MISIDGIILDFYQHHFDFGKDFLDTNFSKLLAEGDIIPLPLTDKIYKKQFINLKRPILNGFLINFILRMSSMETNSFFMFDYMQNITTMGREKCFSNIYTIF